MLYNYFRSGFPVINRMQRRVIFSESVIRKLVGEAIITENRESKNINLARRYAKDWFQGNEKNAQQLIDQLRLGIPNARINQSKYLLGITRLFLDRELRWNNFSQINRILPLIDKSGKFDNNLSGLPYHKLWRMFKDEIKASLETSKSNLSGMSFSPNRKYKIVPIESFRQASKYAKYAEWCVCQNQNSYDIYTRNGTSKFYFCLRNGYTRAKPVEGENHPKDDYGLSMIAVLVREDGSLDSCTSRWNLTMGDGLIMNEQELSNLLGVNFYETFKPVDTEETDASFRAQAEQALSEFLNGNSKAFTVFKSVNANKQYYYIVAIGKKYNIVDIENRRYLFDEWKRAITETYDFSHFLLVYEPEGGQNIYDLAKKEFVFHEPPEKIENIGIISYHFMIKENGKYNLFLPDGTFLLDKWSDYRLEMFENQFLSVIYGGLKYLYDVPKRELLLKNGYMNIVNIAHLESFAIQRKEDKKWNIVTHDKEILFPNTWFSEVRSEYGKTNVVTDDNLSISVFRTYDGRYRAEWEKDKQYMVQKLNPVPFNG